MNEEAINAPEQREPKWIGMTETIQRHINAARDTTSQIRDAGGFILKRAAIIPEDAVEVEQAPKVLESVESRRTVDDSPLSIRLTSLQENLLLLNDALSEIANLIDV